ncbi:hypothetical protein BaRGS_00002402, partial [Batillaria attramentaria]
MGDPRVLRFLQLLARRGFVQDQAVDLGGVHKKLFRFGAQGTLLQRNITKQWWDAMVLQQPNTFCVECPALTAVPVTTRGTDDSQSTDDSPPSLKLAVLGHSLSSQTVLRSSLISDCSSGYLSSLQLSNGQLPVSVASIGQCYNARQGHFDDGDDDSSKLLKNGLYGTHFLLQHYAPPVSVAQTFDFWLRIRLRWWRQFASNPSKLNSSSVITESTEEGLNGKTVITYDFPWGTDPVETISNQGDSQVRAMERETGVSHQGLYHQKAFHPHLIECQTSLEQCISVYLTDAFRERQLKKQTANQKAQDSRLVLQLHPLLSPYQVALSVTGSRSREVRVLAEHIAKDLRSEGVCVLNPTGNSDSMELQYRRNDELGVPYTIVLSDQTLDGGVINIRSRDTGLK